MKYKTARVIIMLVCIALVMFASSCALLKDNTSKVASKNSASQIEEKITPADPAILGDNPFGFSLLLEGQVLTLPCNVDELTKNGWNSPGYEANRLEPGQYIEVEFFNNDKSVIAILGNIGDKVVKLDKSSLCGFKTTQNNNKSASVMLAGGITTGSNVQDVQKIFGTPDANPKNAGELTYTVGKDAYITFVCDTENKVEELSIFNFQNLPPVPDYAKLPEEVKQYSKPESPGPGWDSFIIEYGNNLYKMPVPVAAMLKDGWVLQPDYVEEIQPGQWLMDVGLRRGNQLLLTTVVNKSSAACDLAGCFVTKLEYAKNRVDVNFKLAGDISPESTKQDVENAYGPPASTSVEKGGVELYHYGDGQQGLTIGFDNQTNKILRMELIHD